MREKSCQSPARKSAYDTNGAAALFSAPRTLSSLRLKESNEIEVKLGVGHGLLYKPFKEWVDPAVGWANGR